MDLLNPKSGLYEPHPLNPPTKTQFLAHFMTKNGLFERFGVVRRTPAPPGYGPVCVPSKNKQILFIKTRLHYTCIRCNHFCNSTALSGGRLCTIQNIFSQDEKDVGTLAVSTKNSI